MEDTQRPTDRVVDVGGATCVETTYPNGIRAYRLDPMDVVPVDVLLMDNVGRSRELTVRQSTVLVLVPVGDFGSLPFDPTGQRAPNGWPLFLQRIVLSRRDVDKLIDERAPARPRLAVVQ